MNKLVRCSIVATIAIFIALPVFAQQSQGDAQPSDKKQEEKKAKKEKKHKNDAPDTLDTAVFSERAANDVLGQIRDGLEGHSQRTMLGAFDDNMDGYLAFEDQIEAFFKKYSGVRVNLRILNWSVEGDKGVVTAEFQMECLPRDNGNFVKRAAQLRFELERGKKGWRVVDMRPREFFS